MSGRTLVIVGVAGLIVFAAALWYFQTRAFFRDLPQEPLVVGTTTYPVLEWQGIDADTSPLMRRVCLRVAPETVEQIAAAHPASDDGEPLSGPGWFDCFDARRLTRDLAAGRAALYVLGPSPFDGADDYLALYPDGGGYLWRQLKPELRAR